MYNKYNLTLEQNVFLAKRNLIDNIYANARMEGLNITFPQTKTILEGVNVPNLKIDEIQVIKELGEYLESFLWIFRSYSQKHNNVAYVLSGSMSLQDELIPKISSQNGAFGGRMLNIQLDPFSRETTRNYLNKNAPDLIFTEAAFDRFYKCTSGVPSYVNILNHYFQSMNHWMMMQ